MNEVTVRKVNIYPTSGVPSAIYMKKESDDYFSIKMAVKDGSFLRKLICEDKLIIYSSLNITGLPAAKFDTDNPLTFNVDPADNITSYTVSVNGGPPIITTQPEFLLHMSPDPGDLMTVVVTPHDDIGTNFYPVSFASLVTVGPPIDSGLTVMGDNVMELEGSVDLVLSDYLPAIDRIEYTVGLGSKIIIDPAQSPPKTITVSPIGDEGQIIPVTFYPVTDDNDEYLPVIHNIQLIAKQPRDSGAVLSGAATAPRNIPYDLFIATNNSAITGYTVFTDTNPQVEWDIPNGTDNWEMNLLNLDIGTIVTVTAIPYDGTDQPYNPITYSFQVLTEAITPSGVTLSGPATVRSGDPYVLGITNPNNDITSYKITFNGDEPVTIIGDPDEWIKNQIDHVVGDTVDITVVPLSDSTFVYEPIIKTISILARSPDEDGVDYSGPNEVPKDAVYLEDIITANIHPEVDGIKIYYNNVLAADVPPTATGWSKTVTGAIGDIVEVRHEPYSNNPNYSFNPTTLTFLIAAPESVSSGMVLTGDEDIYSGQSATFNWVYTNSDISSVKVYLNGVFIDTRTSTSYTTPATTGNPGDVFDVSIIPISDTYRLYDMITEDYVIKADPVPIDSGIQWFTDNMTGVGEPVTFTRQGTLPDLTQIEVYLDGVLIATLSPDDEQFTWANNTGAAIDDVLLFTFKTYSSIPFRTYTDTDVAVGIKENTSLSSSALAKSGPSSTTPEMAVNWTFTYSGKTIDTVDIMGDEITPLTGVSPVNTPIIVNRTVPIGDTIDVLVIAHTTDGLTTLPVKTFGLQVNNYVANTPVISSPSADSTIIGDELITWNAPNVSPDNYESITQFNEVSTSSTFPVSDTSTFSFPVTEGSSVIHNLPVMVDELELDKELPELGPIWIRSRYAMLKDGVMYYTAYSSAVKFTIQPMASTRLNELENWDYQGVPSNNQSVTNKDIMQPDRNVNVHYDGKILRIANNGNVFESWRSVDSGAFSTFMQASSITNGTSFPDVISGSFTQVTQLYALATSSADGKVCSYNWQATPMTLQASDITTFPPEMSAGAGSPARPTFICPLDRDSGQVVTYWREDASQSKLIRIEQLSSNGNTLTPVENTSILYNSPAEVVNACADESGSYFGYSDEYETSYVYQRFSDGTVSGGLRVNKADDNDMIIGMYMKYGILAIVFKHRFDITLKIHTWDLESATFPSGINGNLPLRDDELILRATAPDNGMIQTGATANILHEDKFSIAISADANSNADIRVYQFNETGRNITLLDTVVIQPNITTDATLSRVHPLMTSGQTELLWMQRNNLGDETVVHRY